MANNHDRLVKNYLAKFDDADAAIEAIRTYSSNQSSAIAKLKPTGRVLIQVDDLKKDYKVGHQVVPALNGVSLKVFEGEFVAITGSSGSGKSTLLQLMGGLEKPSGGKVVVDDTDLSKMSDRKLSTFRGQTIGFVFQFFYLEPFLTLSRNLEVPGMFARTRHTSRRQRLTSLATAVGLDDRLLHYPKELSGGQIQRAAIARALMNSPKVILADEPTGNLDSKNGAAIIKLFEQIRKNFKTTIVVVTHDASIASKADRRINLVDGVIQ